MWPSVRKFLLQPRTLLVIYILAAVIASIQAIMIGNHEFVMPKPNAHDMLSDPNIMRLYIGHHFTEYNNYVIFKRSFFHLIAGKNLYAIYPAEQWDLYKYSPTFAFLMGLLAYLPDIIGLSAWNLLNALALFAAIRMLPFKSSTQRLLLWFVAIELLTSLQNAQSNGLMAGLMIAAFCFMQRNKAIWATLLLVFAMYIKLYGAIGFCLFLFYPDKLKFTFFAVFWTILFFVLPLIVTPYQALVWQYHNWAHVLSADQSAAYGLSVMGWLQSWFGINNGKTYVTIAGILLFLLPFARLRLYQNEAFRLLTLASMLIWVIIFNHKAESPTFIIAMAGAGIWYFIGPRQQWRTILLWGIFIFTSLSSTDLFPPYIKQHFIIPYTIKAVPCILLWTVIFVELMVMKQGQRIANQPAQAIHT